MVNQHYVAVPVPADLVPDVFRLVLDRTRLLDKAPAEPDPGTASADWPPDDLADFFVGASQNPRAIMELLATRPGERFTTAQLAQAIGKGDEPRGTWSVAGVLGAIQKSAKRRGRNWPFDYTYDYDSETNLYSMPEQYASVIRQAAEQLRSAIAAAREG